MGELYKKCLKIAQDAHKNQTRKDGKPYITHPMAVAENFEDEEMKCIGILHDSIEDSNLTVLDLIRKGVPAKIANVVDILSRRKNEPYLEYIDRVSIDRSAILIKLADLEHNLSDLKPGNMRDKYEMAMYILRRR